MKTTKATGLAAVIVLSLLVFPMGTATAQEECAIEPDNQDALVDAYNENVDEIPGVVRGQVSDQRIDLRIDTSDDERRFSISTDDDGRITDFEEGAESDPTLRVETSESTLCSIVTSDEPAAAFNDAYRSGEIEISGVGIVNSVKVGAAKVLLRLFSGLL
ncbi:MAG: hypothetical protein ACOCSN_02445 [Halanaeroarchaeum sp.]